MVLDAFCVWPRPLAYNAGLSFRFVLSVGFRLPAVLGLGVQEFESKMCSCFGPFGLVWKCSVCWVRVPRTRLGGLKACLTL